MTGLHDESEAQAALTASLAITPVSNADSIQWLGQKPLTKPHSLHHMQ